MKKDRKTKHLNQASYEDFSYEDTRYYGLWIRGKGETLETKIDPKRFQSAARYTFQQHQLDVINNRTSHYFHPAKTHYHDYCCNHFVDELRDIKKDWIENFKPLINVAVKRIEKPRQLYPGDYSNLQMGISSSIAAEAWARQANWKNAQEYRVKVAEIVHGLYSQFIQQMASRVEAITVKTLTDHGMIDDHFDRNILYGGINKNTPVRALPHFSSHDKLYCIWNFLKHNSSSTYKSLKDRFSEVVIEEEFEQGQAALYYVKFSEELILDLIDGCSEFFKEYCALIFNEDYSQAQWNYHYYFYNIVRDEIECLVNPLGLEWWDDLD